MHVKTLMPFMKLVGAACWEGVQLEVNASLSVCIDNVAAVHAPSC